MRALKRHPLLRIDLQEAYDWYEDQCPGLGTEFERDFKIHLRWLLQDASLYADLIPLIQKIDHYFSEQETATRNAHSMRQAIRKLRSGGNVLAIVPTGTRSLSGKLEGEAHEGIANTDYSF